MPDYGTLEQLARELNKPVAYFFCQTDSVAELLCLLDQMTEPERQALITKLKNKDTLKSTTET